MLVIGRRENERIHIAENIVVTVVRIDGQTVRLAIDAPREIPIRREEIRPKTRPLQRRSAFDRRTARATVLSA
jgi:carbon storage regulator